MSVLGDTRRRKYISLPPTQCPSLVFRLPMVKVYRPNRQRALPLARYIPGHLLCHSFRLRLAGLSRPSFHPFPGPPSFLNAFCSDVVKLFLLRSGRLTPTKMETLSCRAFPHSRPLFFLVRGGIAPSWGICHFFFLPLSMAV